MGKVWLVGALISVLGGVLIWTSQRANSLNGPTMLVVGIVLLIGGITVFPFIGIVILVILE